MLGPRHCPLKSVGPFSWQPVLHLNLDLDLDPEFDIGFDVELLAWLSFVSFLGLCPLNAWYLL